MAAVRRSLQSSTATMNTGSGFKPAAGIETWWYGLGPDASLRARHIDSSFKGLKFDIQAGKQRIDIDSPPDRQDQRL